MSLLQLIKDSNHRLARCVLLAIIWVSPIGMKTILGQVYGKTPDRSVYQPPLLVIGENGGTKLFKAAEVSDLAAAPRPQTAKASEESRVDPSADVHDTLHLPLSARRGSIDADRNHTASQNRESSSVKPVNQPSYSHLPHPVQSAHEQAKNFLKPGEEGNRTRPLMSVALDRTFSDPESINANKVPSDSGAREYQLADLIRGEVPYLDSMNQRSLDQNDLLEQDMGVMQVTFEESAASQTTADSGENEETSTSTADSEEDSKVEGTLANSDTMESPLDRLTRFAALPLKAHAIGQELKHDPTCDGCDACGDLPCDGIACDEHGVDCDTSGCDAFGCDSIGGRFAKRTSLFWQIQDRLFSTSPKRGAVNTSHETPWFGGVEYLMMWRRGVRLPSLVVTEVTDGTGTQQRTLVGDDRIMTRMTSGVRLTTGRWMNRQQTIGFVGRGWFGGRKQFGYSQDQTQTATLLRPFLDFTDQFTPTADTQVIAEPGRADGSVSVQGDSEAFGLDLSFRRFLAADYGATIDLLYGYQFVRFNESLGIQTNSVSLDDDFAPVGSTFAVSDSFQTSNEFHGAQLGLQMEYRESVWSFQGLAKLGFGSLSREALRTGETTVQVDSSTSTEPVGLLVRDTNRGRVSNQHFSWVPEIDGTLGWHRYHGWDLTLGYHLLAVTDAIQPCGSIDAELGVNLSDPLVGAARPSADLRYRTFYIHGIHFGLQRVY